MATTIFRRKINAVSSPTYRLPPESLAMVGSYLNVGDLFTAAHVSHYWRTTLLSFPSLWSNIPFGNDEAMLTMLQWSKSAPLRVSIRFVCPSEEVMDSLYNDSARIVSLKSENYAVLRRLLARPMTSLEVLSIGLDGSETQDDVRNLVDDPATVVPSLRTLIVGGNPGGFGLCVPHLTHFKFYGGYPQETDGEILLSVLGVFRRCQMLEVVDVAWGEERYNPGAFVFTAEDVVSLPHLRYLAQEQYSPVDQPWLPDLIHLPQSCAVFLKKPRIAYNSEHIGPVSFPFLPNNSPHLSDIRRVKLGTVYNHSMETIETVIEIVNGQGIILSFERVMVLGHLRPRRDPWAIIDDELNPSNLCALTGANTGSPMVLCLENYQLQRGEGQAATYAAQALDDLENVTTLILSNSAVEPYLLPLEPNNREKLRWYSTVQSLVIYSPSQLDHTGSDILQSLLRVSKKRKIAGAPFRSVTLAIPSTTLVVSPGELAALNEYIERFEFLAGDDALDWDVDKYFIPDHDLLQIERDKSAFDVDFS